MIDLINFNLKIAKSPIHGWGMFANEFIKADTIILQNPGIVLQAKIYDSRELMEHFYPYDENFILGLGYVSLINSSDKPNVKFEIDKENKLVIIKTVRDVQINEEITFKYL
jgi:SET domain-containing protein